MTSPAKQLNHSIELFDLNQLKKPNSLLSY